MRTVTGRVMNGKVLVEGGPFDASEDGRAFGMESIAEIRRGDSVTAARMFGGLRRLG